MSRQGHPLTQQREGYGRLREKGATSIEYALMASFIAIAVVGGVTAVGGVNLSNWSTVADKVIAAIQAALGS